MSSSRPISREVTAPGAPEELEHLQVRDADAGGVVAPLDSAGEREFLRERLALLTRISFITSAVFYVAQSTVAGFRLPGQERPIGFIPEARFQLFFLGAIAILLGAWLVARRRRAELVAEPVDVQPVERRLRPDRFAAVRAQSANPSSATSSRESPPEPGRPPSPPWPAGRGSERPQRIGS